MSSTIVKETTMNIRNVLAFAVAVLLLLPAGSLFAADKDQDRDRDQIRDQDKTRMMDQDKDKEMIYGWQLMSVEERAQHRAKMLSLKTQEERQAYLEEHHRQMEIRAREKGVTLPEVPMQRGVGPGAGMRPGGGAGKGK